MRLSVPALILVAFLALAAGLLVVGGVAARRVEVVRTERDRGAQEELAAEIGGELRRLEGSYEAHLQSLARVASSGSSESAVASAGRNIVGVRHYSVLSQKAPGGARQVDMRPPGTMAVPVPVLPDGKLFPGVPRRELSPELLGYSSGWTWLREPGKPALYYTALGEVWRLVTVDEDEVRAAIDGWLRDWSREAMARLAGDGSDRVVGPTRATLAAAGEPTGVGADWVLPVRSMFGTWRVESWDGRITRESWSAPVLAGTMGGAMLVTLLGLGLAARVRSERRHAEQRVSFVNRVSHELRTPLTNILLNLDAASEQVEAEPASRRLDLVREEAGRLGRLIENVLTFSRREQDRLDVRARACAPGTIVDGVVAQFSPAFARRGIEVQRSGEGMPPVLLDGDALAQIVANLLSNVEKYAPGGAVEIEQHLEAAEFVLTVNDEGPGIPAHAAERVFRPFERLDSRVTEGVTGTGLGLAIARELAHRMGGTLRLLPAARGAAFELRVPAPPLPDLRASSVG